MKIELLQAVINYLGTKPYAEVYELIAALSRAIREEQAKDVDNDSN